MIKNDAQLEVVARQLALAKSALKSLHDGVATKNPKLYKLISEQYVDAISELRGHIKTYKESKKSKNEK